MEGRRAPQGLDAEDKLWLGLNAVHLGYLLLGTMAAYAVASSALPGVVRFPIAAACGAFGAALAWVRIDYRPLDRWVWLAFRFWLRPRRSPRRPDPSRARRPSKPPRLKPIRAAEPRLILSNEEDTDGEMTGESGNAEPRIIALPGAVMDEGQPDLDDWDEVEEPTPAGTPAPVFLSGTQRIAFYSVKGGVGKTTLATEVATLLARNGKFRGAADAREEPLRVALLDLDVASANVAMKLGVTDPTLWELIMHPDPDSDDIETTLVRHDESDLRVLLGPPRALATPESRALAVRRIGEVLSLLDELRFHFVFLDLGSELSELNTYLFEAAHQIYYVLTPSASAVQDTYRGVEALRRLGHRRKLRLVLNHAQGPIDLNEMLADLGAPLVAHVPQSGAFPAAEERHRPAVLTPGSGGREALTQLVAAIYPALSPNDGRRSVWRRLARRAG